MPRFGNSSQKRLYTCDQRLQEICNEAIKILDFSVLCGYRDGAEQARLYSEGKTKLQYPMSKHNESPSKAVDIVPYPIPKDWGAKDQMELARFYYLAGVMKAVAHTRGVRLRFGGDWNSNDIFSDNRFNDLVHYEILDA